MENFSAKPTISERSSSFLSQADVIEDIHIESHHHVTTLSLQDKSNSSTISLKSRHASTERKRVMHRKQYLSSWENDPASFYSSYSYDTLGVKQTKSLCWLYKKTDENTGNTTLGCRLCEKYCMLKNKNGKENTWATKGFNVLALDKIKEHRLNEKHKETEQLEIQKTSMNQPDWISTRTTVMSRQQESIKNLIYSSIYLVQNDYSLNGLTPLCDLLERAGVTLLPAEVSSANYRNDNAALAFIQHVASVLHHELVKKLKKSPVLAWMMDESTSRSIEKSCIVYVRYLDNFEPRTAFYKIINMEGDGSAENIVRRITALWREDDLTPSNTCWLATDNASTFKGANDGVDAKLRRNHMPCLELSTCVAHSYALVGKHSGQYLDDDGKMKVRPFVADFENQIGKIYAYFCRSTSRQYKLKEWYNFLTMPEVKFKRIFEIRWSSIRGCLKPIMNNMKPGNQAILALLEHTSNDPDVPQSERNAAAELLAEILDDRFLFMLHFHFDLHECVSGQLTAIMQKDDLSYKTLMDAVATKKQMLISWAKKEPNEICPWGSSLAEYINVTKTENSLGAFKVLSKTHREELSTECSPHVERLLEEIDRRFPPSELHRSLSYLFDSTMLEENRDCLADATYGRCELDYLRRKYTNLSNFDSEHVHIEWESMKSLIINFLAIRSHNSSSRVFWKNFIELKQATHELFDEQFKNVLILLSIYLISPMNSAECERGYSAANRIQTNSRSRITIETLHCLLSVRLLLPDDIRSARCYQVVNDAFSSWNDPDLNRRLNRVQLMIDVPDDYEPQRQVRSNPTKRRRLDNPSTYSSNLSKPKRPKANAIKCANPCGRIISSHDSTQINAILCCHPDEDYDWIDEEDSCRRWLCDFCRIRLGIPTDTKSWFCEDHRDMHEEIEEVLPAI